ncbi:hypothetical protein BMS3Abin07_02346 [bacterium BMS3Abin07]|nr:hypothetical protein BMS3Abin07_02346 [bacterium BMS3Abin07]GBE31311.1 hypothetical protein BMS3Bbin05_00211 [bacterium BMS3Bbin05]HDO22144.1 DUF1573 domain-containing protein [Nitrospirota bacterium]HDZ88288.1 DUF1573 domain-containing protein [Nitrospirota bacterium]
MKRLPEKALPFLVGIFAAVLFLPHITYAQPKIVFEQEAYNFGDVMQGDDVEHTFVFRNAGTDELIIEKVSTS